MPTRGRPSIEYEKTPIPIRAGSKLGAASTGRTKRQAILPQILPSPILAAQEEMQLSAPLYHGPVLHASWSTISPLLAVVLVLLDAE